MTKRISLVDLVEAWLIDNKIPYAKSGDKGLSVTMKNGHYIAVVGAKVTANIAILNVDPVFVAQCPTFAKLTEKYAKHEILEPADPEFFDKILAMVR